MKTLNRIEEITNRYNEQKRREDKEKREKYIRLICEVRRDQEVKNYNQPVTVWVADLINDMISEPVLMSYHADAKNIDTSVEVGFSLTIRKCSTTYAQLIAWYFDDRMDAIFDNSTEERVIENKGEDIAGAVIVIWSWEKYVGYCRKLHGLRFGERGETESDLSTENLERIFRTNESVLLKSEELKDLTNEEKVERIEEELSQDHWKWNYFGTPDFSTLATESLNL